jgi:hypothetical protein
MTLESIEDRFRNSKVDDTTPVHFGLDKSHVFQRGRCNYIDQY